MTDYGIDTLALHAGHTPDQETLSRAVPIYQTTSYLFRDSAHAADLFALRQFGNIYTRLMNPTTDVLEKRLAAMHGGTGAVATASGQAAIFYAIAAITSAGQNFVTGDKLYGGTYTQFRFRSSASASRPASSTPATRPTSRAAIDENTRLLYTESIGNPKGNVDDFEAIAAVAHRHGIPLIVDNTVTPPPLFNPFDHGADIAVYSLTKMIGGHGTSIGGAVVEKGDFDWKTAGKFPEITEPDLAYHGVNFWDAFGNHDQAVAPGLAYVLKIRTGLLRDLGAVLSPFNSWLFIQGLETLPLRARAHSANALAVASFLRVAPGCGVGGLRRRCPDHPDHERAKKYFPLGPGRRPRIRDQGRPRGGQEVHRLREAGFAPGQHPRRQDPGDPPGQHHPPAAHARGAARGRRDPRLGARLGRHRGHRETSSPTSTRR